MQPYIQKEFGKEIALKLDCKTRWSSMFDMLQVFDKVFVCVQKALIDLRADITFSEQETSIMKNAILALMPIKLAVEALCRRDANLLTTDAALSFLLDNLETIDGEISEALTEELRKRIKERRTQASAVAQYLHGGSPRHNSTFTVANKTSAIYFIVDMLERVKQKQPHTTEAVHILDLDLTSSESDEELSSEKKPTSLKEQMDNAITLALKVNSNSSTFKKSKPHNLTQQIKNECNEFETTGVRGNLLQLCYSYLMSIPPTSVESERAFSASALVCTKIKSSLKDDILNALCFLKAHFQKLK